jgi:hypothetical protein
LFGARRPRARWQDNPLPVAPADPAGADTLATARAPVAVVNTGSETAYLGDGNVTRRFPPPFNEQVRVERGKNGLH